MDGYPVQGIPKDEHWQLVVPYEHKEATLEIVKMFYADPANTKWFTIANIFGLSFDDEYYGGFSVHDELRQEGIAYTAFSDRGFNNQEVSSLRFNPDGSLEEMTNEDDYSKENLFTLFDMPPSVRELYIAERVAAVTPLPWVNQVDYGKVYLTRKLINL